MSSLLPLPSLSISIAASILVSQIVILHVEVPDAALIRLARQGVQIQIAAWSFGLAI